MIFDEALTQLAEQHSDRLTIVHHIDDVSGVVTADAVQAFTAGAGRAPGAQQRGLAEASRGRYKREFLVQAGLHAFE